MHLNQLMSKEHQSFHFLSSEVLQSCVCQIIVNKKATCTIVTSFILEYFSSSLYKKIKKRKHKETKKEIRNKKTQPSHTIVGTLGKLLVLSFIYRCDGKLNSWQETVIMPTVEWCELQPLSFPCLCFSFQLSENTLLIFNVLIPSFCYQN